MPLKFAAATPAELDHVARFLISAFHATAQVPFVDPKLLDWKYFAPRPDWPGLRSFVFRREEDIVAHGCIYPVTFITPSRDVTSMRVIDWAAKDTVPGAGVLLFKKLAESADTAFAPGGSAETRRILPRIGFRPWEELSVYARVVRPWKQFLTQPAKNWKAPIRLARNTLWSLPPVSRRVEWSATRIPGFATLEGKGPAGFTCCKRSVGMLNYALDCPGAVFSAFHLSVGGQTKGYCILSRVGGQSRICDVSIASDAPEDWQAAYSAALRTASDDPETCEVMAVSSIPLTASILSRLGFRLRRRDPIFVWDPRNLLADAPPLHLNLLDGDECFLNFPEAPYLT